MNMNAIRVLPILVLMVTTVVSGCAGQQTRRASSVVDYLYPKKSETVVEPSIPVLKLPIKVGIAFVPEQLARSTGINIWTGMVTGSNSLTEMKKSVLLEKIADHFRAQKFVSDIEVIPSAYLTTGGSFSNLDQIKTMYGIDMIALVSYDQVQFTDEGFLSFTYWTLVGAYAVSGQKNDTSTMMDTAVYDIDSRKMLFRAPGTSNIKGKSTPINLSEELRTDSVAGFEKATDEMIKNLDMQLAGFKEKIKRDPGQVKIVERGNYSGGGVFGLFEVMAMLGLVGFGFVRGNVAGSVRKEGVRLGKQAVFE